MLPQELENSYLWQKAFGERHSDPYAALRNSLKLKLIDLREKVAVLVAQIAKDLPDFTVHDITHLDALWETASLITGEGYEFTTTSSSGGRSSGMLTERQ